MIFRCLQFQVCLVNGQFRGLVGVVIVDYMIVVEFHIGIGIPEKIEDGEIERTDIVRVAYFFVQFDGQRKFTLGHRMDVVES